MQPAWHHDDETKGRSRSYDGVGIGPAGLAAAHPQHGAGARPGSAVQGPARPLRVVLVRDMWLTGFDVPACTRCTSTTDAGPRADAGDRPRQPGVQGQTRRLVVDYLWLAHE
jgi:hypothetical protein